METAPEGPEDVAHGGPGEVAPGGPGEMAHGGPGEEEPEEAGLLGIAQGGLPEAAPAGPIELRPAEKVEVPPFDIWTMARPEGKGISADARVVHPITKELCFPQDFGYVFDRDINHCRKMTEQELQRWLNLTTRREPARPRSSGNAAPVRGREQRRRDRTGRRDVAPIRRGTVTSKSGPVRPTQRQPTPRAGGDRGHRPMQRDEVTPIRQPMPRADPWKAENGWRCLVQGCDWGGPDKSYAGLERHFARRHVHREWSMCAHMGATPAPKENLKLGAITQTVKWPVGMRRDGMPESPIWRGLSKTSRMWWWTTQTTFHQEIYPHFHRTPEGPGSSPSGLGPMRKMEPDQGGP